VISGCLRPHARAARVVVKKLMCPQQRSAAGQPGSPAAPAKTTAVPGVHCAWSASTVTVMARPVSGSAAVIVTGRPSMADMPSASIAHIAYASGPPSQLTRIGVGAGENG
jgi:hypothetical protein